MAAALAEEAPDNEDYYALLNVRREVGGGGGAGRAAGGAGGRRGRGSAPRERPPRGGGEALRERGLVSRGRCPEPLRGLGASSGASRARGSARAPRGCAGTGCGLARGELGAGG